MSNKFLYHTLCYRVPEILKKKKEGGIPALNSSDLLSINITVPDIDIQKRIVDTLDNFDKICTDLNIGLPAEIEKRNQQYEYYRNLLFDYMATGNLSGGGTSDVRLIQYVFGSVRIELGELFNVRNGYTPSKSKSEYWTNGTIPWFRLEDIRESGRILSDSIQKVTEQAVKGTLFPKNSLIMSTTATIGEHALLTTDGITNQQITCFSPKHNAEGFINMKYVYYCFFAFGEWCKKNVNQGGGLPIINSSKLKSYKLSIPSIYKQQKIVDILDRFDTLCNSITSGIPAHINALEKQYEYFRNKLLTFEQKKLA